ncbi:MAG TPA: PilZ domain-containing protein [Myxococcota bacterium]
MDGQARRQQQQRRPRAPFSGWVELTADGRRRRGTALDLSAGGIALELGGELPAVGHPVTSEFALPGISIPLALDGRIVWADARARRLGVCFERVDPGLAELLENFVSGRL